MNNKIKYFILFSLLNIYFSTYNNLISQNAAPSSFISINVKDSLLKISNTDDKLNKVNVYLNTAIGLGYSKSDSAIILIIKAEVLAKEINSSKLLERLYITYANIENSYTGNYTSALYHTFYALKYRKINIENNLISKTQTNGVWFYKNPYNDIYYMLSYIYAHLGNKDKCLEYLNKIDAELTQTNSKKNQELVSNTRQRVIHLCDIYILINDLEKATKYLAIGQKINQKLPYVKQWGYPYILEGNLFAKQQDFETAIKSYNKAIYLQIFYGRYKGVMEAYYGIADAFFQQNKIDSALKYGNLVVELDKEYDFTLGLINTYALLYKGYKIKDQKDKAFLYLETADKIRDSLYNTNKLYDAQNYAVSEQQKNDLLEEQKQKTKLLIIFISIIFVISIIIIILVQKGLQKRKYAKIEEDRKAQELEAAKKLQIGFLPKDIPQRQDLEIATYLRTSTEVGGDYYDFIQKPNNTILSICGDATGHGVASGMMVSVTKSSLFSITENKIDSILRKLNEVVRKIDLGTLRMSLNIVEITTSKVFLASAAMPPILLYKAKLGKVEEIVQTNLPLGGLKNETFDVIERDFESGDVLMQLTDGLPEAPNIKNELYDYHRVCQQLELVGTKTVEEIKQSFIATIDNWLEGAQNPDDITFIIIKKV